MDSVDMSCPPAQTTPKHGDYVYEKWTNGHIYVSTFYEKSSKILYAKRYGIVEINFTNGPMEHEYNLDCLLHDLKHKIVTYVEVYYNMEELIVNHPELFFE